MYFRESKAEWLSAGTAALQAPQNPDYGLTVVEGKASSARTSLVRSSTKLSTRQSGPTSLARSAAA